MGCYPILCRCQCYQKEKDLLKHSHKKRILWKHGPAKLAVLRSYVENQAILEPILLYRGDQNINKPKSLAARTVHEPIFLPFNKIIVSFFSFFCQDANKTRSNCAIIDCNLSKKHKLKLYKTLNGEPNYADHKFSFNFW